MKMFATLVASDEILEDYVLMFMDGRVIKTLWKEGVADDYDVPGDVLEITEDVLRQLEEIDHSSPDAEVSVTVDVNDEGRIQWETIRFDGGAKEGKETPGVKNWQEAMEG